jgi:hypothetical protein
LARIFAGIGRILGGFAPPRAGSREKMSEIERYLSDSGEKVGKNRQKWPENHEK